MESIQQQNVKREGFGSITGILLDSSESKLGGNQKRAIDPDALWLKSRLQGSGIIKMVEDVENVDLDEIEMEEENAEIELNDEEAPFLVGQTHKTVSTLQPVKISKNPDGSL